MVDQTNQVLTSIAQVLTPNMSDCTPIAGGICAGAAIIWIFSGPKASNIWWLVALVVVMLQFYDRVGLKL